MKAKLYKVLDQYHLYDGDKAIATTIVGNPMLLPNLSKQNCDSIFGIIDVEKLAENKYGKGIYEIEQVDAYVEGFNKAMELNKDKLFTLEDVKKAYFKGDYDALYDGAYSEKENEFIQSLQQPSEIEVEIEMEEVIIGQCDCECHSNTSIMHFMACCNPKIFTEPKLDENGCLILRKK
jgi:hypothetical protein